MNTDISRLFRCYLYGLYQRYESIAIKALHASPILNVRILQWHAHLLSPYRYYEVGASIHAR